MKLIILDRDGVINYDSPHYIKTPEEWHAIPGSLEAIAQLKQAGFTVAVASNQSGVSRQLYDEAMLETIHAKMQAALGQWGTRIDKIVYCPHLPDAGCECRKPKPGLLNTIATHFACDLTRVPFVGDRVSDVLAAKAVNASPFLLETGYNALDLMDPTIRGVPVHADLKTFVDFYLTLKNT